MTTTYKRYPARTSIQPHRQVPTGVRQRVAEGMQQDSRLQEEVRKLCGTLNLSATFSEDTSSLDLLKTQGLICIKCILSRDGKPIGIGHGYSVISRINKGIERSIFGCLNGSLMSAVNSACKTLDAQRLDQTDTRGGNAVGEAYRSTESANSEPATERQLDYLRRLLQTHQDEDTVNHWLANLDSLTKSEASEAIATFAK